MYEQYSGSQDKKISVALKKKKKSSYVKKIQELNLDTEYTNYSS